MESPSKLNQISHDFFKQFDSLELAFLQLQQDNESSGKNLDTKIVH